MAYIHRWIYTFIFSDEYPLYPEILKHNKYFSIKQYVQTDFSLSSCQPINRYINFRQVNNSNSTKEWYYDYNITFFHILQNNGQIAIVNIRRGT